MEKVWWKIKHTSWRFVGYNFPTLQLYDEPFWAAQSSSRRLVVCLSVGLSVGWPTFVKKLPLEYQMVTLTYLPFNLYDSSDSSDSKKQFFLTKKKI